MYQVNMVVLVGSDRHQGIFDRSIKAYWLVKCPHSWWCSQLLGCKEFTYFNINKSEIQSPEANCQDIQCQIHFFIKIFFSGLFSSRSQTFFQKSFLWNQQHSSHSFTLWLWQIVWNGLQKTRLRLYFCLQTEDEQ